MVCGGRVLGGVAGPGTGRGHLVGARRESPRESRIRILMLEVDDRRAIGAAAAAAATAAGSVWRPPHRISTTQ